MAYLMTAKRCSSAAALDYVRQRRPTVHPNAGFMSQLRSLEVRLGTEGPLSSVLKDFYETAVDSDDVGAPEEDASEVEIDHAITREVKPLPDTFGAAETLARCAKLRARLHKGYPPPGDMRKRRFA
jgi:hypothetical protein